MPPRTRAALGTRKTRSNNVPDAEQTSLSSIVHPAKRNKRMVNTSERKGRGKGKSRGVQKGKGKANGKREEEEASDSEIETEAAVEASALELEDSASRPPLQLPLRSPSQEKSQTLARKVIPSTIVPPATLVSFHNSTLEAFRVLQAFMANAHTYPSAELAIRHIFGDAYDASQWEPWLSRITSIEPDDEETFQSVGWELDAEISQLKRVESTEEKVNQKNPEGNEDQAQAGGPGDAPQHNLRKQFANTTKDARPEASLPEDNEVESLYADAMLRDPDQACQVLGSFRDYLEDAVMRHCKQSFNFKEFDVWKLARACVPSEYQLARQAALVEWHDITEGESARFSKGNMEDSESGSEGSGGGASETFIEEEGEDEEDKDCAVLETHVGGLTKQARAELDHWHVEYKEGIKEIAAKAGVDMHACFTYLNQQLHPPRAINCFNAFKVHYAEHGTIKKSLTHEFLSHGYSLYLILLSTESLSDYNKFLREEYWRTLESRLSDSEIQDPKARSWVMKPEVDWYREQVRNYIETAKESGKVKGTVKAMICPVLTLAQNLYETSGYHMLGWLINTSTDAFGRSVSAFFAGDHIAKVAKERFSSKMESQVADMETMFRMLEMENQEVEASVAKLHSECIAGPKESRRDVERRLINTFFQHDINQFLGKESNIKLNTFIDAAIERHIRLLNWPIPSFPKANIDTYKQIPAKDVKTIFIPRKAHFDHLYAIQTKAVSPDEYVELGTTYGFEHWTAEEQALRVEDQGAVPLIVDVNHNAVVTIDDVRAWKLKAAAKKLQKKNDSKAVDMTPNAVSVHAPLPRTNAVAGPSRLGLDHNVKRGREEEEVPGNRVMKKAKGKGKGKGKAMAIDLDQFRI
ncbi:hypothetical protein DFH05DRAFT_1462623 [Lentinula detonsa]|uniref:Uncharacterized protein n=1 Tax=Lentinula detonsa TaxID=2804962 RepID=A0A9W8NVB8_9AGAR|nr:hypothetical protein DFH05DRAFT_1462623 [Lentinula detonsa]